MQGRVWTISNVLSMIRVVLVLPIAFLTLLHDPLHRLYAVGLIALAASTDMLDGVLARRLGQVTEAGKIIDPLADKIAVGVVAVILAQSGMVPVWFVVAALGRDTTIFLGGLYLKRNRGIVLQSNLLGKWTVTAVAAYIVTAVLGDFTPEWSKEFFLFLSTVMLVASFVSYARRYVEVCGVQKVSRSKSSDSK